MQVRVKRLRATAIPPRYMSPEAAGADLYAAVDGPIEILPGQRFGVPTGWALAIPNGYEGQVRPRSGLAKRSGLTVANAPGTIDADYRGELVVLLINLGSEPVAVSPGDRIAQLVVAPVAQADLVECDELDATERGTGGFGSTGGR